MTAQGEDLLAYLDRAITEREAAAQTAASFGDAFSAGPEAPDCVYGTGVGGPYMRVAVPGFEGQTEAAVAHFALYGPESVLRRCAADRTLINLHQPDGWTCKVCANEEQADEDSEGEYHWSRPGLAFPCPTIEALAEGYGWTEGER